MRRSWVEMEMLVKKGLLPCAAVVTALALGACGSSDSESDSSGGDAKAASTKIEQTPAIAKLVAEARKEGALNLNWGMDGPDANLKYMADAFNKAYGLNIKFTLTPNQDMPGNLAKLIQEAKAGRPASTDALYASASLIPAAGPKAANVLEKVDWASIDPTTAKLATDDSAAVSLFDRIIGFTYNKTQFSPDELPKTAADVAKLSKPVASTPYAAQFNVLGTEDAMGVDGLKAYVKSFKPAGLIGCGELNRVASGEFAGMWIGCGKNIADIFAKKGAPLDTAIISDAALTSRTYMALPKNSQHPAAAKLWIVFLSTPGAQKLLFDHQMADNRDVAGSRTAGQIAGYEAKGIHFENETYEFVNQHHELYDAAFRKTLIGLLTHK